MANPKPGEQVLSIDNKVVAPAAIKTVIPQLPAPPPNLQRRVFEVAGGADGTAIQDAIDAAAKLRGQQPVVHLPAGEYKIAKTLVIPANTGVQLVGDGFETQLEWAGKTAAPAAATVLRLAGPSRAVLRELSITGAGQAAGVVVENCDQPGARVFMEQGNAQGGPGSGLLADGLDNADVSLHDFYHSGCKEVGVKAVGGLGMAAGRNVSGHVVIFGGASSNNTVSYDVVNGGRILAEDIWYEGAPPRFIHFTPASSGTFTLNGATTATGRLGPDAPVTDPNFAAIETDDFRGNLTLLNVIVGTNIVVGGEGQKTNVFSMVHGNEGYFSNHSPQAHAVLYGSTKYTPGGGAMTTPNVGQADPDFILKMLAQLRHERPRPLANLKGGITDVRIFRVNVSNCLTDFHLQAK
ncbi:MAG: hypothetical protein JOZ57_13915, partial [Abitibacteriaceae bacterium]|nr:hypothetical protein [Abditibacteriaceae bacterium]